MRPYSRTNTVCTYRSTCACFFKCETKRVNSAYILRRATARRTTFAQGNVATNATRIQVEHQTHLPLVKDDVWQIIKEMTGEKWKDVASLLAALECVYRFEYNIQGEELLSSLQLANDSECFLDETLTHSDAKEFDPILGDSYFEENGREAFAQKAIKTGKEAFKILTESKPDAEMSVRSSSVNVKAREADASFINSVIELLGQAHYVPLDIRDVALAKSLNLDYLSQIYIKAATRKLDGEFVGKVVGDDLPLEARKVLIFKRSYDVEERSGTLLLRKLDYIQVLVVLRTIESIKKLMTTTSEAARKLLKDMESLFSVQEPDRVDHNDEIDVEQMHQNGNGNWSDAGDRVAGFWQKQRAVIDRPTWKKVKSVGKDVLVAMNEWGISPKLISFGGGSLVTLADWGFFPGADVTPLENFNNVWPVSQTVERSPLVLRRTALNDAIGQSFEEVATNFFRSIELAEPAFSRLVVIYRYASPPDKFQKLTKKLLSVEEVPQPEQRNEVQIRVYEKIPIPIWKAVLPEKLLQFRPLDGLRLDLITLLGLAAVIAQARYDSIFLELATILSILVYGVRVFVGYKRMYDRFDSFLNDLLVKKTIASQEGALAYLASAAAYQQFKQCALGYALLSTSKRRLSEQAIAVALEHELKQNGWEVAFDSHEALSELTRFGLVEETIDKTNSMVVYGAVEPQTGIRRLRKCWDELLANSVDKTLNDMNE